MVRCGALVVVAALACLFAVGCADSPGVPTPTGWVCPSDSTLTYEGFGKPFMERYCTRCHASTLHGPDRMGAPLYHDFDSLLGVVVVADHVDEWAAAGPEAVNEFMPPNGDKPTLEERQQLGEWVACEVVRINNPPDAGPGDAGVTADASTSADAGVSDAAP